MERGAPVEHDAGERDAESPRRQTQQACQFRRPALLGGRQPVQQDGGKRREESAEA